MRMTKLGSVLGSLTIAAAGAVVLLGAAPAQALADTQVTLSMSGSTRVIEHYKTFIGSLTVQLSSSDSTTITNGQSVLQRKLPGKSWKIVKTDADPTDGVSYGSYGDKALGNVQYRVHFAGGTDGTNVWASSTSNVVSVYTGWNVTSKGVCTLHGCKMFGKVSPKAKHHRVVIQVLHNKKTWKTYKKVKTNGKSRWTVSVRATRAGLTYRAVVAPNKQFVATGSQAWFFHTQARTALRPGSARALLR